MSKQKGPVLNPNHSLQANRMMKLLLNGHELEGVIEDETTLGVALLKVQNEEIGNQEVISSVWIDGEPLTAERLAEWKDRPTRDFCEARINAPTRRQLTAKSLTALSQSLTESKVEREQIVDHICKGRSEEAMKALPDYLEIWNTVQRALAGVCRLLDLDLESLEVYGPQAYTGADRSQMVTIRLGQLTQLLQQMKDALQAADLVVLGDIVNYDLADLTDDWQDLLEELADRFGETYGSPIAETQSPIIE